MMKFDVGAEVSRGRSTRGIAGKARTNATREGRKVHGRRETAKPE